MNEPIIMSSHTIVENMYESLKKDVAMLTEQGLRPSLAVVLVGHEPNSVKYVAVKQRQAALLGIECLVHRLDEATTESTICSVIEKLNAEKSVGGIIVQLPLPEQLNTSTVINTITPVKDVDGLTANTSYMPPTVDAIMHLLEAYEIVLTDKQIVVVGQGRLVGGPITKELRRLKLNVTVCDQSIGSDLGSCTLGADILISATGQKHLIKPAMIKENAVVIDVDEEVVYDKVLHKVSYITPQKGGIGPLTVACLFSNLVEATKLQAQGSQ